MGIPLAKLTIAGVDIAGVDVVGADTVELVTAEVDFEVELATDCPLMVILIALCWFVSGEMILVCCGTDEATCISLVPPCV